MRAQGEGSIPSNDLRLPVHLRRELKDPWGVLLKPETDSYREFLRSKHEARLITIGDVCTKTLITEGKTKPFLLITDGVTKREKLAEWEKYEGYEERQVWNPAGMITREAYQAIREVLAGTRATHLLVNGEEDLLVLPAIIEGKQGDLVIYGQPNEGMVIVRITVSKQLKAKGILSEMESG